MNTITEWLAAIPRPDESAMSRAREHIDGLLKPPGSLGVWKRWRFSWEVCRGYRAGYILHAKLLWLCAPTTASGMKVLPSRHKR